MKKIYTIHVYKIYWTTNDDTYVSSTRTHLIRKISYLKCNCKKNNIPNINKAINKYGIDNFKYSLIKSYDVSSIDEQKKWEQYHIDILKPTIHSNVVYLNKEQRLAKRNATKKIWINKNKDKMTSINKRYYDKNKESIIKSNRIYASTHKELISARGKQYYQYNKNKISVCQRIYRTKCKQDVQDRIYNYIELHIELLSLFKKHRLTKSKTIYFKKNNINNNHNNIFYRNNEEVLLMHKRFYYKRRQGKILEQVKIHKIKCDKQIHSTICNFYHVHTELLNVFKKNDKGLFIV